VSLDDEDDDFELDHHDEPELDDELESELRELPHDDDEPE
jgi:hypothetical protein